MPHIEFNVAAWEVEGKSYIFWKDSLSDTGHSCWVTRGSYSLMEDPIDHLYRWVHEGDYDKDFNKLAIFPNLAIAYEIAEDTR